MTFKSTTVSANIFLSECLQKVYRSMAVNEETTSAILFLTKSNIKAVVYQSEQFQSEQFLKAEAGSLQNQRYQQFKYFPKCTDLKKCEWEVP